MRNRDRAKSRLLLEGLQSYEKTFGKLPGIAGEANRKVFTEQLLESIRRVEYIRVLRGMPLSDRRTDPQDTAFDPVRAAIINQRRGEIDEAFWLTFLFAHFGKHSKAGWRYIRDIYGRMDAGGRWDWATTSSRPEEFRQWLDSNQGALKAMAGPRGFGNHRKYQSLGGYSKTGTGATIQSYVEWISPPKTHAQLFNHACDTANGNMTAAFDKLYRSMQPVVGFGRTGRFDYLTMIGKLGLAPIAPGSPYLSGSTGPLKGARLLFGGTITAPLGSANLETKILDLDSVLNVGMQVIEDALCNWQKSPGIFEPFRG